MEIDIQKKAEQISMLGAPALKLLTQLASKCDKPILEIGPYVGGSTLALAAGTTADIMTIEIGGANTEHPELPTSDIINDLRTNLSNAGLLNRVEIINGHFRAESVLQHVTAKLQGCKAGLLFIDTHPGTEVAVGIYASKFLADDAFLVIDDYQSDMAADKARFVKSFIEKAIALDILEPIGVFGWGTWFGRLCGVGSAEKLAEVTSTLPCVKESGQCWHIFVGNEAFSDDVTDNQSPLRLFEDGREIGFPHTLHQEIREKGGGGYSHWLGQLWFSTSDNSDPRLNGRIYSIKINNLEYRLDAPIPLP